MDKGVPLQVLSQLPSCDHHICMLGIQGRDIKRTGFTKPRPFRSRNSRFQCRHTFLVKLYRWIKKYFGQKYNYSSPVCSRLSLAGTWRSSSRGGRTTGTWPTRAFSSSGTTSTSPQRSYPPPSRGRRARIPDRGTTPRTLNSIRCMLHLQHLGLCKREKRLPGFDKSLQLQKFL